MVPTLSVTEALAFISLRTYLLGVLPNIEVFRGQVNLVPEPQGQDFAVMWPLFQNRLATNFTTYADNIVTGYIAGNVFTCTGIVQQETTPIINIGNPIFDLHANISANTTIVKQLAANGPTPGFMGTYQVSGAPQTIPPRIIYIDTRSDLVATQWSVQLDVHGPNSADNSRVIEGLFRSEYATTVFDSSGLPLGNIAPLYCDEAKQIPFINAEQQYENRWVLDLQIQLNPVITTVQQFAQQLQAGLIPVDIFYK